MEGKNKMIHSFDTNHAEKYGVGEAILIQNMIFWIEKNRANRKHFYDGRTWTYNSVKAFSELFPYYTGKQIRKILDNLISAGVLMKGYWSEDLSDRSTWYAFVHEDDFLTKTICPTGRNHLPNRASHLPHRANHYKEQILNTDKKPDNKKEGIKPKRANFVKPSVDEVKEFMKAEAKEEEAERFWYYYESKGWTVGKSSMKDWKAAARGWMKRANLFKPQKGETHDEMVARKMKEAGF